MIRKSLVVVGYESYIGIGKRSTDRCVTFFLFLVGNNYYTG